MMATTKIDIVDEKTKVPKGTLGKVVGCQWGERGDGYIIDFPNDSRVFVSTDKVTISDNSVMSVNKKKSLIKPTVGKGSEDDE